MSPGRWLITIASFAVSIGISIYVVARNWPPGGAPIALSWAAHGVALAAVLFEIFTRTVKITWSAAALRIPLRFATALRTNLAGDFGSAITPGRSGGEPARFLVLSAARVPATSTLLLLYSELLLEMITLAILAIGFGMIFTGSRGALGAVYGMIAGYAGTVLALGAFGVVLARRNARGKTPRWARYLGFNGRRWRRVQRALRRIRAGGAAVRDLRWGWAIAALSMSVLHVLARLAILPALVYLSGGEAALAPIVLWPLALLYGAVVSPAPGGGGVVEVGFTAVFAKTLAPGMLGAALIWWRFYTFYLYVIFGALAAGGTVLRALRGGRPGEQTAEGEALGAEDEEGGLDTEPADEDDPWKRPVGTDRTGEMLS